ncbi:MAG TPA: histidine kinase dimerization/phospho-acceptor domain-containing protein [Anaeromyxobacteraceae bacterium]|jgi:signal transduction histidine kinase|nr:histidine kinase dimerization/phospho-acceptor domain-containing protein [Anaeromyxobacteraceae bacterium]
MAPTEPFVHDPDRDTEEQRQLRGSQLGFVAHEMRNPLSTALWSAELLAKLTPEDRGGARGEKLAGMCLRSLNRLRHLVEDHFLAERLAVGGLGVRLDPVALADAVDAAAAKLPEGTLSVQVSSELAAWADRGLLERAIDGILSAVCRGEAGAATVHATVEGRGGPAVAELRFSGGSLAPDALEEPHKGSPSDTTGRALALVMAKRAVAAMGGRLALSEGALVLALSSRDVSAADVARNEDH